MMENKDLAIKLFGMKIPLSTVLAEEQEDVISSEKKQNETLTEKDNKTLKKPTKIIPCPRCKSMETKFCYYNNYNVNQPRHFCKACQRYWTSGGTMRSVPVGAGRRKNRNNSSSSSPYHHVTISEPNGPVLSFSLGDINQQKDKEMNIGLDCFQGVSWPYTWNPGLYPVYPYWNVPIMSSSHNSNPSSIVTSLGKHAREENETMRRKKMNGTNVLVPKTLRIDVLGLWASNLKPIGNKWRDDPNEAAKSSIWTTLGIKNDVMFKGFDSKKEINNNKEETETSLVLLCSNPAALSRSNNFHEHM